MCVFFSSFILDCFNAGQQVDVILTDFSKVFDSVDHNLLVKELDILELVIHYCHGSDLILLAILAVC